MHNFPIAFALAPESLRSIISKGALAINARALRMMDHATVKLRWATPRYRITVSNSGSRST